MVLHRWAVPDDGDVEDLGQVAAANPFSGITVESFDAEACEPDDDDSALAAVHLQPARPQ